MCKYGRNRPAELTHRIATTANMLLPIPPADDTSEDDCVKYINYVLDDVLDPLLDLNDDENKDEQAASGVGVDEPEEPSPEAGEAESASDEDDDMVNGATIFSEDEDEVEERLSDHSDDSMPDAAKPDDEIDPSDLFSSMTTFFDWVDTLAFTLAIKTLMFKVIDKCK